MYSVEIEYICAWKRKQVGKYLVLQLESVSGGGGRNCDNFRYRDKRWHHNRENFNAGVVVGIVRTFSVGV